MICAPITGKTIDSALKTGNKAIKLGADILELRIDYFNDPNSDELQNLIDKLNCKLIATNRMREEGGLFEGSEKERIDILIEIADYVNFIDIELQTEVKYRSKVIRASNASIISYHNFEETPNSIELLKIVEKEKMLGDIAKFAVMPKNIPDTLTVLEVLSQVENTIGISMGDLGKYTRIVSLLFGSPLTFASVDAKSAPGQFDIETTKKLIEQLLHE